MTILRHLVLVICTTGCAQETVYLSRFWGFCLLAGIGTLLLLTCLVNFRDKRVFHRYFAGTIAFGLSAALCFPGWAMKSPEMSQLLKQIESLRSLVSLADHGALRNASSEKVNSIVLDCRKLKKDSGTTSYTQLKEDPSLSACLRKLAQFRIQQQSTQRSEKGMAQARSLLNAAEKTIQRCRTQRRPLSANEKRDVQEQIAAAEQLIKGRQRHLPKAEQDRLIRKLYNTL